VSILKVAGGKRFYGKNEFYIKLKMRTAEKEGMLLKRRE